MKGCLQFVLAIIVLGVLALVGVGWLASRATPSAPQASAGPARLPTEPRPAPAIEKTGETSPAAEPRPPAAVAAAPTAPLISVKDAQAKVGTATTNCLQRLAADPKYKKALADQDYAFRTLKALRELPAGQDRLDASSNYGAATKSVHAMEAAAITSDPEIDAAKRLLDSAQKAERDAEEKKMQEIADANNRRLAEQERIRNSPVNKAIREHRLIEGMSTSDATAALGKPYALSQTGAAVSMTWQNGDVFWSGIFLNDSLISVSVARF